MSVTAVQILNNHVLPFFEEQGVKTQAILSDNGREYCGRPDKHPYELFLQLEDVDARSPWKSSTNAMPTAARRSPAKSLSSTGTTSAATHLR